MTDEFDDMEEWMTTWKTEKKHVSWSREDFARRRVWQYVKDLGSLLALGFAAVVIVWRLFPNDVVLMATGIVLIGYFGLAGWSIISRIRNQRQALPLSVPEYLEKMRHNLELREKQLRWDQWSLPPLLVFAGGAMAWMTWSRWDLLTSEPYRLVVVLAVVSLGIPYALYTTYKRTPEKIRQEREHLDDIEDELSDEG